MKLQGSMCQCAACGLVFGSERGFDDHRTGSFAGVGGVNTRTCLPEQAIQDRGYRKAESGVWRKSLTPSD